MASRGRQKVKKGDVERQKSREGWCVGECKSQKGENEGRAERERVSVLAEMGGCCLVGIE